MYLELTFSCGGRGDRQTGKQTKRVKTDMRKYPNVIQGALYPATVPHHIWLPQTMRLHPIFLKELNQFQNKASVNGEEEKMKRTPFDILLISYLYSIEDTCCMEN